MTAEIVGPVFAERGGVPYSDVAFSNDTLRAELCEVARRVCFEHSNALVDELLATFDIRKRSIKEKR
jgi:hypothetical protein